MTSKRSDVNWNLCIATHTNYLLNFKSASNLVPYLSLSTVVLNSRIDQENYGFPNFHTSNNHLKTGFC